MKQIFDFRIDLFAANIFVLINSPIKELPNIFPGFDIKEYENGAQWGLAFGDTHIDGKYRWVIWLHHWDLPVFIHEAYHVTRYILNQIGSSCDETGAYIIEYVTKRVMTERKLFGKVKDWEE